MKNRFWTGFWRLADPKISLASFASMFLGACAAAAGKRLDFFWLAVTILGVFAIEVAKNASGEIFDYNSGNDQAVRPEDRSPFSGGKRVLMDDLLTKNQTAGIAAFFYIIGSLAGISIVIWREPSILWLGVLGIALAFFYHAPPLQFSYRGLGEMAVAISYGPLICTGTYLVQRGELTPEILVVSILLGVLIALFLLINEFPDYHADQVAQKRTIVVRLGRKTASRFYLTVLAVTFLVLLILPLLGFPAMILLGIISVVPAYQAAKRLGSNPETISEVIPAQANTLFTFVLFAVGTGLGFLFGGIW
jgi:1,4-dihydroxy-2-naphthoate octaprenyltransferase